MRHLLLPCAVLAAGLLAACASDPDSTGDAFDTPDAASPRGDASSDGATHDATSTSTDGGAHDAGGGGADSASPGADAGTDALAEAGPVSSEPGLDAGNDAGRDAASAEGGIDAGGDGPTDAGGDGAVAEDGATDAPPDGSCSLTSCGAQSVCSAGQCVAARRAFVSSATMSASMGGHAGADAKCQTLATTADLGGTWMAWLSDSTSSPSTRFTPATVQYALLSGTVVAPSWTALVGGSLSHGIDMDENGHPVANTGEVWTATDSDGTYFGESCSDFSSAVHTLTVGVGISGKADSTWSYVYDQFCDRTVHVYCFEQ